MSGELSLLYSVLLGIFKSVLMSFFLNAYSTSLGSIYLNWDDTVDRQQNSHALWMLGSGVLRNMDGTRASRPLDDLSGIPSSLKICEKATLHSTLPVHPRISSVILEWIPVLSTTETS